MFERVKVEVPRGSERNKLRVATLASGLDDAAALCTRDQNDASRAERRDGVVRRFSNRGGEDHLTRCDLGKRGDRITCVFDKSPNFECFFVGSTGISLGDLENLAQGVENLGTHRGDRCVIKVGPHC